MSNTATRLTGITARNPEALVRYSHAGAVGLVEVQADGAQAAV